jgi:hypothetical protein
MDDLALGAVEWAIRHSMTAEQCVRIERLARAASQALEALIGEKVVDLTASRRCPHCGAVGVVKHGLMASSGFAVAGLRPHLQRPDRDAARAHAQARDLAGLCRSPGRALDWVHAHLGIARLTAWRWRHRLLTPLTLQPAPMLSGIVEADEAYFLRSFKGHRGWKNGAPPENRPPRYRGSGAVKRGLSSEQVPVVTALDRVGGLVEVVLEERRDEEIITALRGAIAPGSLLCSDGHGAYPKLAEETASEHRTIEPFKPTPEQKASGLPWRRPGVLTLGRVNGHHSVLKNTINGIFRGVSTRYLPNYLAWLRALRDKPDPIAFLAA